MTFALGRQSLMWHLNNHPCNVNLTEIITLQMFYIIVFITHSVFCTVFIVE